MKALALVVFVCACGSTVEEEPRLHVDRVVLPDLVEAPIELKVGDVTMSCPLDCAPALVLPVEPVTLKLTDALGDEFSVPIVDLGEGKHVVNGPLAPEAGVFLEYTAEYSVR